MDSNPDLPPPTVPVTYYCNKCGYMGPDGPTHSGCSYFAASSGPYWDSAAVEQLVRERDESVRLLTATTHERIARAEQDAARYQFLREYKLDSFDNERFHGVRRDDLDTAIDLAMNEAQARTGLV